MPAKTTVVGEDIHWHTMQPVSSSEEVEVPENLSAEQATIPMCWGMGRSCVADRQFMAFAAPAERSRS